MDFEVKNIKGDVSPQMIDIAVAAILACEEAGMPKSFTIEVEPLEGGESKS